MDDFCGARVIFCEHPLSLCRDRGGIIVYMKLCIQWDQDVEAC